MPDTARPPVVLAGARWEKLGLLAAVLVADAAIAWLADRLGRPETLAFVAAAPLVTAALLSPRRLQWGTLGIVLTAALVRLTLSTGTQSRIVMSLIVAAAVVALWVGSTLVSDRRPTLKPAPTNVPVLAFIAASIIAYAWSLVFRDPLVLTWESFPMIQLGGLIVMVLLPAVFLLVSNVIEDVAWLKRLWGVFLGVGTAAILANLLLPSAARVLNARGIFPLWIVSLTYPQALFNRELRGWQRLGLLGVCGLWLTYQLGRTFWWLSGWVPTLVGMLATTFLHSKRLFVVLALLLVVYVGVRFDFLYQRIYVQSVNEGDLDRVELWGNSLELVQKHPLFGTGPGGYVVYYYTYHRQERRTTHNDYLDILAQTGLVGFAAYLSIFATLLWTGYRLSRRLAGQRSFEAAYANGLLGACVGALVAMMLGDWMIPFVYNQTIMGFDHAVYAWVLMGSLVSLHHVVQARERRSPPRGSTPVGRLGPGGRR